MNKGKFKANFISDDVKGVTTIYYDYLWFENASSVYNHDLARFCSQLAMIGYDVISDDESLFTGFPKTQVNLRNALEGIGFSNLEINPCADRDEVSYFIAQKQIELSEKKYNLIFSGFIGSHAKQWFSNFDPLGQDRVANGGKGYADDSEKGSIHLGFADARDYMYGRIVQYMSKNKSDCETKLLLTGHSRGAGAANLLAAKLISNGGFGDDFPLDKDNIYTYAFATPNVLDKNKVDINKDEYKRIFNIVSPEDFVTEVLPEKCGYTKFGTIYRLLGRDNDKLGKYSEEKSAMQRYFKEFKDGGVYHSFKNGNGTVARVAEAMAKYMPNIDDYYNRSMSECFKKQTPFEYFKYTLCAYIAGGETEEEKAAINRALKLLLASSVDLIGTAPLYRTISGFFVFKEGIGGTTGGKISSTYFRHSHIAETYCAYMLSISEENLLKNTEK